MKKKEEEKKLLIKVNRAAKQPNKIEIIVRSPISSNIFLSIFILLNKNKIGDRIVKTKNNDK